MGTLGGRGIGKGYVVWQSKPGEALHRRRLVVERAVHRRRAAVEDMSVNHGGAHVFVADKLSHRANIVTSFQCLLILRVETYYRKRKMASPAAWAAAGNEFL